jgi:methylated-DNA-[protein]-cysteine S-methyltransferase
MSAVTDHTTALRPDRRQTVVGTDLGPITLVADDEALTGLYFAQHWPRPDRAVLGIPVVGAAGAAEQPILDRARSQLEDYLAGRRTSFDLPTKAEGDDLQLRVWALLDQIPYGTTTTYGELAEQLGDRTLAQLVGQAVGRNPLSIVVPCHRVVGAGGRLTGYAGGLDRKRRLLELEQPAEVSSSRLF